jgi:hypothetical protein
VIASGAIHGHAWRIAMRDSGDQPCAQVTGPAFADVGGAWDCTVSSLPAGTDPAGFDGVGANGNFAVYGPVAADVAVVKVRLSDGGTMTVRPVRVDDLMMAGFAVPAAGVTVDSATAYTAAGQAIATGVPYEDPSMLTFGMWQPPGSAGPARASAELASGPGWRVTGHTGPWGACLQIPVPGGSEGTCWTAGPADATRIAGQLEVSPSLRLLFGSASASTSRLEVTWPDGHQQRIRLVTVGELRLFVLQVPPAAADGQWKAYDSSGRVIASGPVTTG